MSFELKYPTECAECGEPMKPGELARYDAGDEIVHAGVCVKLYEKKPEEKPCPRCTVIHRGEC